MNELVTKDSARIASLLDSLDRMLEIVGTLSRNYRPVLGGERFLTDKEVADRLKISRRTLQEYRDSGKLPYTRLGGKILYLESDIEKILRANYRRARV